MIISKNNYRYQDLKYLICRKIWLKLLGKVRRNGIGVYYVKWSDNFGDLLTPIILKKYGWTPYFEYQKRAKISCVGTIISLLPSDFNGWIVGSGWNSDLSARFPVAKFLGVRGNLTKVKLGLNDDVKIGDPGLLMSDIYSFNESKKFLIGIIPHESEVNDSRLFQIKERLQDDCVIIKPNNPSVKEVLSLINQCEYILSSSLHGLIIADSYGIPNGRIKLNDVHDSNDFKFRDYYSSLDEDLRSLQICGTESKNVLMSHTRRPPYAKIDAIKLNLDLMFKSFRKIYHG